MNDARLLWDELLRLVGGQVADALKDYRPDLARSTGVVPGNRLPTGGNTGGGYTPAAHAATHEDGGADPLDLGALAGELTDDQHGSRGGGALHAAATTSAAGFATLAPSGGTTAGTVVQATDSRLSDARTPTAHHATHQHGGSDEVAVATPAAHAIPKAGSDAHLDDSWLSSAIMRVEDLSWDAIPDKPATFPPSAHASSHQHGGSDEVATATPAANAIPKAGSGGTIADGWLSSAISRITSIALAAPAQFSVSGSPLTANGTLTLAWQNQSANVVLAGPSSGSAAAPAFRALVAADIPPLDSAKITSGEIPRSPLTTRGDLLTQNPSGAHTRLAIGATGRYLRSDGTDPSWAQLDMGDAAAGTLAVARGGTGLASYAIGDLLYASGAAALSKLADVATGNALISGGVGAAPSWGKIDLTAHISGVLPAANGGTGVNNGSNTLTIPAAGTAALRASAATAGRVGFWSSATELSHDGALLWDNTNKWLGINVTPTVALDVAGSARIVGTYLLVQSDQATAYAKFYSTYNGANPIQLTWTKSRNGAACSANDVIGDLAYNFFNSANTEIQAALLRCVAETVTSGSEASRFQFYVSTAGSLAEAMRLTSNKALLIGRTSGLTGAGDLDANGNVRGASFRVGVNQVVGARVTGWALPTGTLSRATFDQSTVTLAQLAQRVAAIITDLYSSHGMIGA